MEFGWRVVEGDNRSKLQCSWPREKETVLMRNLLQDHSGSGPAEGGGVSVEEAARQLAKLGFTERDSHMAIASARPSDTVLLSSLLDWLCIHLPEEHLPASFAPGVHPPFTL